MPSLRCRLIRTFHPGLGAGTPAGVWNRQITPRRAICAGSSLVMSVPLKWMMPLVNVKNLVNQVEACRLASFR